MYVTHLFSRCDRRKEATKRKCVPLVSSPQKKEVNFLPKPDIAAGKMVTQVLNRGFETTQDNVEDEMICLQLNISRFSVNLGMFFSTG